MDVIKVIYDALIADSFIKEQASGRIKYYEYPESGNVAAPYIIIVPLDVPNPSDFADNTWLTYDALYQIEVWTKNRAVTMKLAERIQQVMWKQGFFQNGGIDEYEENIFRDARRYRGKLYRDDLDTV
ncbi:hypothetical protein [Niallia sp. NCCP-28]|uniref:hypothetical protein n=1 Tax=Niallia sp. NCCP-28 TaxID=2934712 RepID=UPI00208D34AF|nr:hypothetical protein [Niallia sp. NCCP-28]GKU81202.1 hypothetical protein NCCP28_05980 [Niallia sp. NCCP-28]